jgi:L-fucose isomerase-like protein
MQMPLGTFSPSVKLAFVSASRNCFPRSLSEARMGTVLKACADMGIEPFVPEGDCRIIESKEHAERAAAQAVAAGCDAAVLYLGNFSPEIEDAAFVKAFPGTVMLIAAAEESGDSLAQGRGDALCGLLSATLALSKRNLMSRVYIPEFPVLDASGAAAAVARFHDVVAVVKGMRSSTLGLFGPRPRDFETCNYNIASLASMGVEVEELGFFDLVNEIKRVEKEEAGGVDAVLAAMEREMPTMPKGDFGRRLAAYERAVLNLRERLGLSGMTSQCWSEQEYALKHVPCYINARMAARGFPIACENDAYSLAAELLAQYASGDSVAILDVNHSIPQDLHAKLSKYPNEDLVGLFHCGNTDPRRLNGNAMKHQVIMKRMMEPEGEPDITRGTVEGAIAASPITVVQVHGVGDKLRAYVCEGQFLDLDPRTFGSTGTAYLPGFGRFYRHVLLGRFHHHAAIAFARCGAVLFDALRLLGIEEIYSPLPEGVRYPGENPFATGFAAAELRETARV